MAQKLYIQNLVKKYQNFFTPNAEVYAAGQKIEVSETLRLETVEVVSGVCGEPDMAVVVYRADRMGSKGVEAVEKHLDVGEKMEIKAGYGDCLARIFLGYLHEVKVCCGEGEFVEYTLLCFDVKGLMKKNSSFQASGKKKAQQVLDDILDTGVYGFLIEKKSLDALPADFNLDCVVRGDTHYDWLCRLASYLDYEFYCWCGEFVFRKAGKNTEEAVKLTREYGLREVSLTASMEKQTGSVQVNAYNRGDERIQAVESRKASSGPFLGRLNQTLQGCSRVLWDMGLESAKQASASARTVMERNQRHCLRMEAVNCGIPELKPGMGIGIEEKTESLSGVLYAEEVEHILDDRGYRTIVRGARK